MIIDLRKPNEKQVHHKHLAPSSAPAILQCACYWANSEGSDDTDKGTDLHNITMDMVCEKSIRDDVDLSDRDDCRWAADEVLRIFEMEIPGADIRIEEEGKIITGKVVASFGHMDFNGNREDIGVILDLKGGLDFNIWNHYYEPQLKMYALMQFQKYPEIQKILCGEIYIKPNKKRLYWVNKNECEVNFAALVRRRSNPNKRPCLNDYCKYCARIIWCEAINKLATRTTELYSDVMNIVDDLRDPDKIDCPLIMAQALNVARQIYKPLIEKIEGSALALSEMLELPYFERKKTIRKKKISDPLAAFDRVPLKDTEFANALNLSVVELSKEYAKKYGVPVKHARHTVENLLDDLFVENEDKEDKFKLESLLFNQTKKNK